MIIWLDAHLSPQIASWISDRFGICAIPIRDLGLHTASDSNIFSEARKANAILMTKDRDFVRLVEAGDPPPHIILLSSGNTSNAQLKRILEHSLASAVALISKKGEPIVEIASTRT
jgi:predicted nuclease of predicted toxin-antitoxin system